MTSSQLAHQPAPSIADLIALSHIYNGISSACVAGIGYLVTTWYTGNQVNIVFFLCAILATMFISNAGFIVNDIFDLPIDRINRPDRPLAAGKVTVSLAWALYAGYNILGILLALAINLIAGAITLAIGLALFLYSYSAKRKFLIGHVIIAALGAALLPFGGIAAGSVIPTLYTAPIIFAAFISREVLKTVPDVEGDRANGVDNIATRFGPLAATRLAQVILGITAFCLPLVQLIWTLNSWFNIIVVVLIWPMVFFMLFRTLRPDDGKVKVMLRLTKLLFLLVAAAFLIGSIR